MAERRMFAKAIIDSDAFLDMPLSAQALYFHLSMRADDEGFVGNPKKIRGMIGASEDDFRLLFAKRFLLGFDSGVIVIKHWYIHNYIQKDRFHPTTYTKEREALTVDDNKAYTDCVYPNCIQNGYNLDTQDRLGEVSIGKDNSKQASNKKNIISSSAGAPACEEEIKDYGFLDYDEVLDDFGVDDKPLREKVFEFIKHLKASFKIVMINSRLQSLIVALDMQYRSDNAAKIREIDQAIRGGLKYLPSEDWGGNK